MNQSNSSPSTVQIISILVASLVLAGMPFLWVWHPGKPYPEERFGWGFVLLSGSLFFWPLSIPFMCGAIWCLLGRFQEVILDNFHHVLFQIVFWHCTVEE